MTERTGLKRPDYRLLANTGERILVEGNNSEQTIASYGESIDTTQDTEYDFSSALANGSSSSLTNTSTSVEASGAASALISPNPDLSLTDSSSQSTLLTDDKQVHSPITDISA